MKRTFSYVAAVSSVASASDEAMWDEDDIAKVAERPSDEQPR